MTILVTSKHVYTCFLLLELWLKISLVRKMREERAVEEDGDEKVEEEQEIMKRDGDIINV